MHAELDNLEDYENPLKRIVKHYLEEDHLPTAREYRFTNITLAIVAATGAPNYIPPTISYLNRDDAVSLIQPMTSLDYGT